MTILTRHRWSRSKRRSITPIFLHTSHCGIRPKRSPGTIRQLCSTTDNEIAKSTPRVTFNLKSVRLVRQSELGLFSPEFALANHLKSAGLLLNVSLAWLFIGLAGLGSSRSRWSMPSKIPKSVKPGSHFSSIRSMHTFPALRKQIAAQYVQTQRKTERSQYELEKRTLAIC